MKNELRYHFHRAVTGSVGAVYAASTYLYYKLMSFHYNRRGKLTQAALKLQSQYWEQVHATFGERDELVRAIDEAYEQKRKQLKDKAAKVKV